MRLAPSPRGRGLFLPTLFVMSAQNQVMDSSMTSMTTFKGPKWAIKVLAAGKSAGKPVGIFGLNAENAAQLVARGFDFCSVATDTTLYTAAIQKAKQVCLS